MSLDWDNRNVRTDLGMDTPERQEWWNSVDDGMFQSMAFGTMSLGINHIKDVATAQEFYRRHMVFSYACGTNKPYLTLEFLYDFIGFKTNASNKTLAEFKKTCWEIMQRNADWATKKAVELQERPLTLDKD